jgi:hypothetical protein
MYKLKRVRRNNWGRNHVFHLIVTDFKELHNQTTNNIKRRNNDQTMRKHPIKRGKDTSNIQKELDVFLMRQ